MNVLGKVSDPDGVVVSLTYRLNGGPVQVLSIGTTSFFPWRLSNFGDFNVEIDPDVL